MLGQVPKWTKGADCKSVAIGFQGSNPCLPTRPRLLEPLALTACEGRSENSSGEYTSVESRLPSADVRRSPFVSRLSAESSVLLRTDRACGRSSVVEFQPSKLAVRGSNPLARSILMETR